MYDKVSKNFDKETEFEKILKTNNINVLKLQVSQLSRLIRE